MRFLNKLPIIKYKKLQPIHFKLINDKSSIIT